MARCSDRKNGKLVQLHVLLKQANYNEKRGGGGRFIYLLVNSLHVVDEVGQLAHHYVAVDVGQHAVVVALTTRRLQQRLPHLVCIVG